MSEPNEQQEGPSVDPRVLLAEWANSNDEWVRSLVAEVLTTGRAVTDASIVEAYQLFRQEKALDERTLPAVDQLSTESGKDEEVAPLVITRLSEVHGVNALVSDAVIEPHEGLTILYGENGTGKTGYSRIFKALASSRTADEILGNINEADGERPSATLDYKVGDSEESLAWEGEHGVVPFTRMSIFDSPSVSYHVDDELEYVYVPAALALFNHAIAGIAGVQSEIDTAITALQAGSTTLLSRFPKESTVYPLIETLGASTDLEALRTYCDTDPKIGERIESLQLAVAALQSNTIASDIALRQREIRVLKQASEAAAGLGSLNPAAFNELVQKRSDLGSDYETFRSELFAAAGLPAEPEDTWSAFIAAGDVYRRHLEGHGVHEPGTCLYCRQPLADPARELLEKYATYLQDKITADLDAVNRDLSSFERHVVEIETSDVDAFIREYRNREDKPSFFDSLEQIEKYLVRLTDAVSSCTKLELNGSVELTGLAASLSGVQASAHAELEDLESQAKDRTSALAAKRAELAELQAAAELSRSWVNIESLVANAKEADRLKLLKAALPKLSKSVTELSKTASDQMINQSFDLLFAEECQALRAPELQVQFVGRKGKAQRKKVLSGKHRPSKVLSEGEQKVLAMADFLAEARLAGITAPVILDDPVSSLDHRRINEVAQRVAALADSSQVIVFTHDIFFATTLLLLFEKSKRCSYFHVTDEGGNGKVTRATGPRWDTLSSIKAEINKTIQAAGSQEGEARAALIRTGYDWVRAWCEVFTEAEMLRGVTQRYQPNVGMTRLASINTEKLPELISTVTEVFERACRFIDGHSQPLVTLGVSPTLEGLEEDWATLQECKKLNGG